MQMPVLRGKEIVAWTLLDADDAMNLAGRRLSLSPNGYVRVRHEGHNAYLHRVLLGLASGDKREGDHRNRTPLDNRRANLRIVEQKANRQNVNGRPGTSRYRGVHWSTKSRSWIVQVTVDGRTYTLGAFTDEDLAGRLASEFRQRNMPMSEEVAA